ncbi:hypothetical protein TGVEG_265050 [Toxoplasma gondii VEG]|uniref:Uncharacterized protein n=3 Tax=Toxoplasma gondii TaxID=5811 RepID=V5BE19_TOXGV|nr:hypothetical protein TGVEG_265050 [Toxoplasma gondii VEG]KFG32697.1 hypothetical protein TGP89_265050 [Toxoplasma gondii p89]
MNPYNVAQQEKRSWDGEVKECVAFGENAGTIQQRVQDKDNNRFISRGDVRRLPLDASLELFPDQPLTEEASLERQFQLFWPSEHPRPLRSEESHRFNSTPKAGIHSGDQQKHRELGACAEKSVADIFAGGDIQKTTALEVSTHTRTQEQTEKQASMEQVETDVTASKNRQMKQGKSEYVESREENERDRKQLEELQTETPKDATFDEDKPSVIQHSFCESRDMELVSYRLVGSGLMNELQTERDDRVEARDTCVDHQETVPNQEHQCTHVAAAQGKTSGHTENGREGSQQAENIRSSLMSKNAGPFHLLQKGLLAEAEADASLAHAKKEQEKAVTEKGSSAQIHMSVSQQNVGHQNSRDPDHLYAVADSVQDLSNEFECWSRNDHVSVPPKANEQDNKTERNPGRLPHRVEATVLGDNEQVEKGTNSACDMEREEVCSEEASISRTSRNAKRHADSPLDWVPDTSPDAQPPTRSGRQSDPLTPTSITWKQALVFPSTRQNPLSPGPSLEETKTIESGASTSDPTHTGESTATGNKERVVDRLLPGEVPAIPGHEVVEPLGHNMDLEQSTLHETSQTHHVNQIDTGVVCTISTAAETDKAFSKILPGSCIGNRQTAVVLQSEQTATKVDEDVNSSTQSGLVHTVAGGNMEEQHMDEAVKTNTQPGRVHTIAGENTEEPHVDEAVETNIQSGRVRMLARGNKEVQNADQGLTSGLLGTQEEQMFNDTTLTTSLTIESGNEKEAAVVANEKPTCPCQDAPDTSFSEQAVLPPVKKGNARGQVKLMTDVLPGDDQEYIIKTGEAATSQPDQRVMLQKRKQMKQPAQLPTVLSEKAHRSGDVPEEQKTERSGDHTACSADKLPKRAGRKKSAKRDRDRDAAPEPDLIKPKLSTVASDEFSIPLYSPNVVPSSFASAIPASPITPAPPSPRTPRPMTGITALLPVLARRASRKENTTGYEHYSSAYLSANHCSDGAGRHRVRQRGMNEAAEEMNSVIKKLSCDSRSDIKRDEAYKASDKQKGTGDPPPCNGTRKRRRRLIKLPLVLDEENKEVEADASTKRYSAGSAEGQVYDQNTLIPLVPGPERGPWRRGRIRWTEKQKCFTVSAPRVARERSGSVRKRFFVGRKASAADAFANAEAWLDQQIEAQDGSIPEEQTQNKGGKGTEPSGAREEERGSSANDETRKEEEKPEDEEREEQHAQASLWVNRLRPHVIRDSEKS